MLSREKQIISGEILELETFPVTNKGYRRNVTRNKSREAQKKLNFKNQIKNLTRLINANFGEGDLIVTLQYNAESRPKYEKEILRDVQNYFRRLKHYIKKYGLPQLKYIYCIELANENNWHAHLIVSKINKDIIKKLWHHSTNVWVDTYKPQKYDGGEGLARYFLGQKGNKDFEKGDWRSWNSSKNLRKPIVVTKDRRCSRTEMERLVREKSYDEEYWEKQYKGYRYVHSKAVFNAFNGYWYIYVLMRKNDNCTSRPFIKKESVHSILL